MTNREMALKKLSAAQFTLWEMHLYLDTHPWDTQMCENYKRCEMKYKLLRKEFEENYFPLTAKNAHGYEWLQGPWPWEYEECGC